MVNNNISSRTGKCHRSTLRSGGVNNCAWISLKLYTCNARTFHFSTWNLHIQVSRITDIRCCTGFCLSAMKCTNANSCGSKRPLLRYSVKWIHWNALYRMGKRPGAPHPLLGRVERKAWNEQKEEHPRPQTQHIGMQGKRCHHVMPMPEGPKCRLPGETLGRLQMATSSFWVMVRLCSAGLFTRNERMLESEACCTEGLELLEPEFSIPDTFCLAAFFVIAAPFFVEEQKPCANLKILVNAK